MKFLRLVFGLLLISILVLQPEAFYRLRHRSSCSAPPIPAYTHKSGCNSPYTQGERCDYRCRDGYIPVSGSTNRTCSDGRWPGTNLVCRKAPHCSTPPYPAYTYRRGCSTPYKHGERCTYRCLSGYFQVSGSTTRTCSYGTWTGTNLVCGRNVRLVGGNSSHEGRVEVLYDGQWGTVCDDSWGINDAHVVCRQLGYPGAEQEKIRAFFGRGTGQIWLDDVGCTGSETSLSQCSHGGWGSHNCGHHDDAGVVCAIGCPTPPSPANTIRSDCISPYTQGDYCTYQCHNGYILSYGTRIRICSNGIWTGSDVFCSRGPPRPPQGCSTPPSPAGTTMSGCFIPYTHAHGKRCTYRCDTGYIQVSGSTTRTCSDGTWSGSALVCRRNGCPTPPSPANTVRSGCVPPYTDGERCYYRCRYRYIQVSGNTTIICSSWAWTGTELNCIRKAYTTL